MRFLILHTKNGRGGIEISVCVVNKSGRDHKVFRTCFARGLFSTLLHEILDTPLVGVALGVYLVGITFHIHVCHRRQSSSRICLLAYILVVYTCGVPQSRGVWSYPEL